MGKTESKARGVLIAVVLWLVIFSIGGAAFRYLAYPYFKGKLAKHTGSKSQYKQEVRIAADSFSGYAILRSPVMSEQLKQKGIKLTVVDDKADYDARLKACRKGENQMSVFTIDALLTAGIKAGIKLEELPTIVGIIDESFGCDAIAAYKGAIASLQQLNSPDVKIMLTPNSPSEFLARIVLAHFAIASLPEKWQIGANGAADVYKKMKAADRNAKVAYVLWEPYVSMALEDPDVTVLVDSSKVKGYIFDVICAHRQFLEKHPEIVREVIESYLRALYYYTQDEQRLISLVIDDARKTGSEHLTEEMARKLVKGIHFKNTLENYAHFGLLSKGQEKGLQNLEDIITNVADVLIKTGAIPAQEFSPGKASMLFYDKILADMRIENFHPSQALSIIKDINIETGLGEIEAESELPRLTDEQWNRLVLKGELRVKPISFLRGTAKLTTQSSRDLDELVARLKSWPRYYLIVTGHARQDDDEEQAKINLELAGERAGAAVSYLAAKGVSENRMRTKAELISGGGEAQSVSFAVGQLPY